MPLTLALVACFSLMLAGCRDDDENSKQKQNSESVVQRPEGESDRRESLEMLVDNAYIRHVFNRFNREIETHLIKPDGSESTYRRDDGSLKEELRRDKKGTITRQRVFAKDGKTVLAGLETRQNGSTVWTCKQESDGSIHKSTYWYDGKQLFSVEITRKDGSIEAIFYRKNGMIWQKKKGPDSKNLEVEQYDYSGLLSFRQRSLPDGSIEILRFDRSGQKTIKVVFREEKSAYGYKRWTAVSAEEYDESGSTVRRRIQLASGNQVLSTETFNPDGSRTVRTMRSGYGSYIETEETFDQTGKSLQSKKYGEEERVSESVDRYRFDRPELDDPQNNWQNQENYPYSRYGY